MATKLQIINPIEQNFSCNNCGFCCTTQWKIKVAPERVEGIKSTSQFQRLEKEGFIPLPIIDGEMQVGRRDNGACVFHSGGRGGCAIHREKGSTAKPIVCQIFPYSLINSPEGYYLSLSFSCPSVVKGLGRPVSEQVAPLQKELAASSFFTPNPLPADSHVAVTHNKAMSWKSYVQAESALLDFLRGDHPVRDALKAAILLARHSDDPEALDWTNAELDGELFAEAAGHFPFYAAYTIATLENQDRPEAVDEYCNDLLDDRQMPSRLLSNTVLPTFQISRPPNAATEALVNRYIENYVLGKHLISVAPMTTRLLMLSVGLATLFFYLEARADGKEVDEDDLAWCFHLVETCVLGHSEVLAPLFAHFESELLKVTSRSPG